MVITFDIRSVINALGTNTDILSISSGDKGKNDRAYKICKILGGSFDGNALNVKQLPCK